MEALSQSWLLQEGFGLPSSTVLCRRSAGCNVVSPEASGRGQGVCLNRQNSVAPAIDSLEHRARACYLPCSLLYNELCHAISIHSLSVPLSALLNVLCTESIKAYIVLKQKKNVFHPLFNSYAGPKTQQLNVVGSWIKLPSKLRIKEA